MKQRGFTLLELIVIVAVLGVIATMATEYMVQDFKQDQLSDTKKRWKVIRAAVSQYYQEQNEFPSTLSKLVDCSSCAPPGGPYLVNPDFDGSTPVYRDGWWNSGVEPDSNFGWEYRVASDGQSVTLRSLGMDGAVGGSGLAADYPSTDYPLTSAMAAVFGKE